jgi:signal transduction histidine kinase
MNLTSQIKKAVGKALGISAPEPSQELERILSGSPAQIIQAIFDEAYHLLSPRLIQLLVEESNSGRMFLWHSELRREGYSTVNSDEFDLSTADAYLQLMPTGDWILQVQDALAPMVIFEPGGKRIGSRPGIPEVLHESFGAYVTVVSVGINLGDEWRGRFVICDPAVDKSPRANLDALRQFSNATRSSIHTAHLCLRACREAAAEERSRLARELHDGTIQSMLGAELRLEGLKRRLDQMPEMQQDVDEIQGILRREAGDLRNMVNDSRRRALRPERLTEFLSDLLERFQRETGVVTRFFADLHNEPMPPRICHEIARLAEEGLINAQKHSRASALTIRVGSIGGNWVVVIVDDGVGFDFRGTWSLEQLVTARLGPRVIKERVLSLDGNLIIESTPTGARIEISIPQSGKLLDPFRTSSLRKSREDEPYSSSNS